MVTVRNDQDPRPTVLFGDRSRVVSSCPWFPSTTATSAGSTRSFDPLAMSEATPINQIPRPDSKMIGMPGGS
jgi:hypothetical protein